MADESAGEASEHSSAGSSPILATGPPSPCPVSSTEPSSPGPWAGGPPSPAPSGDENSVQSSSPVQSVQPSSPIHPSIYSPVPWTGSPGPWAGFPPHGEGYTGRSPTPEPWNRRLEESSPEYSRGADSPGPWAGFVEPPKCRPPGEGYTPRLSPPIGSPVHSVGSASPSEGPPSPVLSEGPPSPVLSSGPESQAGPSLASQVGMSTPPRDNASGESDEDYLNRSPLILPPIRNHRRVIEDYSGEVIHDPNIGVIQVESLGLFEHESSAGSDREPSVMSELTLASSSGSDSSTLVGSAADSTQQDEQPRTPGSPGGSSVSTVLLESTPPNPRANPGYHPLTNPGRSPGRTPGRHGMIIHVSSSSEEEFFSPSSCSTTSMETVASLQSTDSAGHNSINDSAGI